MTYDGLKKQIMRFMREDFDPTPPNWEDRDWNDNAEDVADKILAVAQSEKPTHVSDAWRIVKRWLADYAEEEATFSRYADNVWIDGIMVAAEMRRLRAFLADNSRPADAKYHKPILSVSECSAASAENKTNNVRIDVICMALDDAAEYFASRLDIRDGADERRCHTQIVSALHALNGIRKSLEASEKPLPGVKNDSGCADEASCTESYHDDDGVPYCDKCGLYRASKHNRNFPFSGSF